MGIGKEGPPARPIGEPVQWLVDHSRQASDARAWWQNTGFGENERSLLGRSACLWARGWEDRDHIFWTNAVGMITSIACALFGVLSDCVELLESAGFALSDALIPLDAVTGLRDRSVAFANVSLSQVSSGSVCNWAAVWVRSLMYS
jgi:hypothetical protein